jgi:hypothetical protein
MIIAPGVDSTGFSVAAIVRIVPPSMTTVRPGSIFPPATSSTEQPRIITTPALSSDHARGQGLRMAGAMSINHSEGFMVVIRSRVERNRIKAEES